MVARLLAHYWTADEPAAMRRAQAEDWIEDLVELPLAAVAEACREWRRQPGGRRPTPGDIRTLAVAAAERLREAAPVALPPPGRNTGFPSHGHYRALREKGFAGRGDGNERWEWHAYDYGWRRVILGRDDDNSPIDPERAWYSPALADQAEAMWRAHYRRPKREPYRPASEAERAAALARSAQVREEIAGVEAAQRARRGGRQHIGEALRRVHRDLGVEARIESGEEVA